jgi:hypothetical protein
VLPSLSLAGGEWWGEYLPCCRVHLASHHISSSQAGQGGGWGLTETSPVLACRRLGPTKQLLCTAYGMCCKVWEWAL